MILPASKDTGLELLEAAVQNVPHIPLLASTVTRQTDETAEDTEAQQLGLMSHDGTQSRLTSLPLLTRQEDVLCALLLPANSTDAELLTFLTTYQENRMGHFVLVYAQTEKLP